MKLNENPDTVYLTNPDGSETRIYYRRDDAISFIMFEDGFTIYSKTNMDRNIYGHSELIKNYKKIIQNPEDLVPKTADNPNLPDEKLTNYVKTHGTASEKTNKILQDLVEKNNYYEIDEILKGRIWTESKVVSFWDSPILDNLRKEVVDLVKIFDNPKEYIYEISEQKYNLDQFLNKKQNIPKDKVYFLKNKTMQFYELEKLRVDMHTKAGLEGKKAKFLLCILLDDEALEQYPELKGYKPPDCSDISKEDQESFKKMKDLSKAELKLAITKSLQGHAEKPETWGSGLAKGIIAPRNYTSQQTKALLRGSAEPTKSTIVQPGDFAGMQGRLGFRRRTQKEIDKAWDLNNESCSFRKWLMLVENKLI